MHKFYLVHSDVASSNNKKPGRDGPVGLLLHFFTRLIRLGSTSGTLAPSIRAGTS